MLEIIIILVIIGIIVNIITWIKDHIEAILGIIFLLAGIALVAIIAYVTVPAILPFLPYVLLLGIPCVIIYRIIMKIRSYSYRKWINSVGIGPQSRAPGSKGIWRWAEKHKYTVDLGRGYILSAKFCDTVLNMVDQQKLVSESAFINICLQVAPQFQLGYMPKFLIYLADNDMLLAVDDHGQEMTYLSRQTKRSCEHQFKLEGAATKDEFSTICQGSIKGANVEINSEAVAGAVLNNLVSKGSAHIVELSDLGDKLFVSNENLSGSKMTRREISLD